MGVLGGVLGLLLIGSLIFFIIRRRRDKKQAGPFIGHDETPGAKGYNKRSELETHPSELSGLTISQELPTYEKRTNDKDRVARVDDRAAAGYEGAYRGN